MAKTSLQTLLQRWKHIDRFAQALLEDLCTQMVATLSHETPGKTFPTEWTFAVQKRAHQVLAEVWNTRVGSETKNGTEPSFERIANYLNDGTDDHMVKPVTAKALHWVVDGKDFFSKGHVVSGITASHFLEKTDRVIDAFTPTIQRKLANYLNHGKLP